MTILTESVFTESQSARDNQLSNISPERATEILGKVKTLYFALWQGTSTTVTDQIANFYEVPEANFQKPLIAPTAIQESGSAEGRSLTQLVADAGLNPKSTRVRPITRQN